MKPEPEAEEPKDCIGTSRVISGSPIRIDPELIKNTLHQLLYAESEGTMATQIVELKAENKELKTRLGKAEQRLSDLEIVIFDEFRGDAN